jgi:hypothetical protein
VKNKNKDAVGSTPKEFLKTRRPHLFSDSEQIVETALPRKLFEYHLESITSRKEEVEFENFCRRIVQREICPNLRPQTGPTGGGDSKADSSSYAVDPDLAERVFWGSPALPTPQRWCFAYSAKKDWAGKVRSDVKGLAGIVPPPDKIYFVTSRYARDKKRGEMEAELLQTHGIPVEVLDREWLLTKTYENGHTDIAVDCFHIGTATQARRLGPKDAGREAELQPLLEQLKKPDEHYSSQHILVEEYLRAAHLARGVDRPRHEVEGLLAQARRLAASTTPQQLLRAQYDLAWTSFWWFDDPKQTLAAYEQMESSIATLLDANDVELHANILNLIMTAVAQGRLERAASRLDARFDALVAVADTMALDKTRAANALHARTASGLLALSRARGNKTTVSKALDELHTCLTSASGLVHYPLLSLADTLEQMGEFLADYPGYDRLFEALCDLRGRLLGDRERAVMLLRNGYRLYQSKRYPDALRALGAARRCALEKDSVLLLADVALVTSCVYEASALFWAARMELAMAAHLAITEARRENTPPRQAVLASLRLAWLEMRLGRIPCALAWHELASGLIAVLKHRGENVDRWQDEIRGQDGVLSLFFLAADEECLRQLTRLPDALERLGLHWSRWALLFALGHEDILNAEGFADGGPESPSELYAKAFTQPAMADIPTGAPTLHVASFDAVETDLLGMKLRIEHENEVSTIALAENLISAAEAWFATATWDDIAFLRSKFVIRIREKSLASNELPDVEKVLALREIGIPPSWTKHVHDAERDDRSFTTWILQFLGGITSQAMPRSGSAEAFIMKLAKAESFARALSYLPVSKLTLDDIGEERLMLDYWNSGTEHPLRRTEAWWRANLQGKRTAAVAAFTRDSDVRPPITVADVIDVAKWDQAKWHAAAQLVYPDAPHLPPILGLVFRDPDAGVEIFEDLVQRLKEPDCERLRVAVILGEGGTKCDRYVISIGPDFGVTAAAGTPPPPSNELRALVVGVSRMLEVVRTSDTLSMFLQDASAKGKIALVPAMATADGYRFGFGLKVECANLVVRAVADVGEEGDQDGLAARKLRKHGTDVAHTKATHAKARRRKRKPDKAKRRKR